MKGTKNITSDNCLEVSSECVTLAIPLPYLGLCKGDTLTAFTVEVVKKLEDIAGEDISTFDVNALLDICNLKAPSETTLISILSLLRDNQVCLKDFLLVLEARLVEILNTNTTQVNLKCYATFDSIGNPLNINRNELDQLIINELCDHKLRLSSIESNFVALQNQVNNITVNPIVAEPLFSTCVDAGVKATSAQVVSVANEVCDLRTKLGPNTTAFPVNTTGSFANKSGFWNSTLFNTAFGSITGWITTPSNEVEYQRNIYLILASHEARLAEIETNCCAPTCDKILIGYSMILDSGNDYIMRFRASDGNVIPSGFTDAGSTIYFKDVDGVRYPISGTLPIDVTEEESDPYDLSSLNTASPITVYINAKVTNGSLQCDKCTSMTFNLVNDSCPVCQISTSGTGTVTVVYSIPDPIPSS